MKIKSGKRKWLKRLLISMLLILLITAGWFTYFFIFNQAPIINGKVLYQIPYKNDLKLDVYLPTRSRYEKTPVILFFHGGGWITGRKESINFNRFNEAVNTLRDEGYAFVCPEYTLARDGISPFPDCIGDAFDALYWVEQNAAKYNFDLHNVGLFGESAGAHIALMTGLAPAEKFTDSIPTSEPGYLIDVYGPNNLEGLYHMNTIDSLQRLLARLPGPLQDHFDITQRLFGFDPDLDTTRAKAFMRTYSPLSYLSEKAPPMLIIHGSEDQLVPLDQSTYLASRMSTFNRPAKVRVLDGVNHAFIGATEDQKKKIQEWIIEFAKENYRRTKP